MGLIESASRFVEDKIQKYRFEKHPGIEEYIDDDFLEEDSKESNEKELFRLSMEYRMKDMEKTVDEIKSDLD